MPWKDGDDTQDIRREAFNNAQVRDARASAHEWFIGGLRHKGPRATA